MKTHIINTAASPVDVNVWKMFCGEECFAFDDGTLVPELDFISEECKAQAGGEKYAQAATCVEAI